jgi:cyclophilin family peptidyl-prolyl cis-trans isomerase/HEAT repeat protein
VNLSRLLLFSMLVLPLGSSGCGRHQLNADEIQRNLLFSEILKRADRRTVGEDGFFPRHLTPNEDPEVQEWCVLALARIGTPGSLPWLYEELHSPLARLRAAAAFALGVIEDRRNIAEAPKPFEPRARAELTALLADSSADVQMRAIEALGKIGGETDAVIIAEHVRHFLYRNDPAERAWLDLAIMALCRLREDAAIPVLEGLAQNTDPEIQWRALNALTRLQAKGNSRALFLRLLDSPSPDVQAYAARGLGHWNDPQVTEALLPLLPPRSPSVARAIPLQVRISALQALGKISSVAAIDAVARALDAEPVDDAHPDQTNFAIQAAAVLGNTGGPGAEAVLERLLRRTAPVAGSAIVALAKTLKNDPDRFFSMAAISPLRGPAGITAWAVALGELQGSRADRQLRQMLEQALTAKAGSDFEFSAPAILEALRRTAAPDLPEIVTPLLTAHDGPTVRAALAAYRPSAAAPAAWQPIVQAYLQFEASRDSETKVALVGRLEPWIHEGGVQAILRAALQDRERNVRIASARLLRRAGVAGVSDDPGPAETNLSDTTYQMIAAARKDRTLATLQTAKGTVEIELFREDAPLTVANFISLARSGFYDGLSFMRVVPFFVVQGGDPRNDQEGGPGYSIRCEINLRPFERGSLGMALSGKDTGGSQFFITLAPQPHLDGAYTNFGRVISGMQVVDRLVPGDLIERVEIGEEAKLADFGKY